MYTTAYKMLLDNKDFCLEETMAFINAKTQSQDFRKLFRLLIFVGETLKLLLMHTLKISN
jgi:hypothetical protein